MKHKQRILKSIPTAVFNGDTLISPLPKVKFGYKVRTENEFIELVFIRYSVDTVVEAMKNNKIILNL
jgi:hypothetical protein